jgi:hypothetical protein
MASFLDFTVPQRVCRLGTSRELADGWAGCAVFPLQIEGQGS